MVTTLERIADLESFILDPYLVLYLPLYELDGASFMSRDAYGHLCTVTGAGWRPNGRYFDGVDDIINCGNAVSLQLAGAMTAELWINPTIGTASDVMGKGGNGEYAAFLFQLLATGQLYFSQSVDGASWGTSIGSTVNLSSNTWFHIVGVSDLTIATLYINTVVRGTDATPAPSLWNASVSVSVGAGIKPSNQAIGNYFTNYIGEVRIYNRALTPAEIMNNYLATKWRYC